MELSVCLQAKYTNVMDKQQVFSLCNVVQMQ